MTESVEFTVETTDGKTITCDGKKLEQLYAQNMVGKLAATNPTKSLGYISREVSDKVLEVIEDMEDIEEVGICSKLY